MEKLNIKKSANLLYQSRIKLNRIKELPNKLSPTNNKEAYLIQDELTKIYLNSNPLVSIIGKKIGCTNKEAQKQLNVNESFFGNIFSNYISSSNKKISSKNFFSPYVEPEFSFLIKALIILILISFFNNIFISKDLEYIVLIKGLVLLFINIK